MSILGIDEVIFLSTGRDKSKTISVKTGLSWLQKNTTTAISRRNNVRETINLKETCRTKRRKFVYVTFEGYLYTMWLIILPWEGYNGQHSGDCVVGAQDNP
jgi:hypothetical protein